MNYVNHDILNSLSGFTFLIGIAECLFGYRLLKIILWATGFIIGGLLCAEFAYAIMKGHPVIASIIGLVGGAIGGSLMVSLFMLGLFILGTALGLLIGDAISASIYGFPHPAILVPMAIVWGIATIIMRKNMIIISTSFIGAYLIVCSVGEFIGMPNTIFLWSESGAQFFVMLFSCILVGIVGYIVQSKDTAASAENRYNESGEKSQEK